MKTLNLGKIIPQKYLDYWTPEDITEIEGYINKSVTDSLGDYETCLDKIIEIQNTINGEFIDTPTAADNRTSLGFWYGYLYEQFHTSYEYNEDGEIIDFTESLRGEIIEELPFPVGTQNVTNCNNFLKIFIESWEDAGNWEASIPAKRFTGVLNIPKVTALASLFYGNRYVECVGEIISPNVTDFRYMFNCSTIHTICGIDLRSATNVQDMFYNASNLTNLKLKNIGVSLTLSYSTLLTVDSLVGLIYELRNTGSSKTLSLGDANLEKLTNVYVRIIEITDEMRAEDDLIDEKLPFEVCESTDDGAMLITNYVALKNWKLQ